MVPRIPPTPQPPAFPPLPPPCGELQEGLGDDDVRYRKLRLRKQLREGRRGQVASGEEAQITGCTTGGAVQGVGLRKELREGGKGQGMRRGGAVKVCTTGGAVQGGLSP